MTVQQITVNYESSTEEVVEFIRTVDLPEDATVERIGAWVWVTFIIKPAEEIRRMLSDAGFHWNNRRKSWAHNCGVYSRGSKGNPRDRYDTEKIK